MKKNTSHALAAASASKNIIRSFLERLTNFVESLALEQWYGHFLCVWLDELAMIRYLNLFQVNVNCGKPCALMHAQYPSHCTQLSKEVAEQFHIELIYIPKNVTGALQSLDRRIFGITKTKLRYRSKAKVYSDH